MPDEEPEFEYQGYLIFNDIYKTNLDDGSEFSGESSQVERKLENQFPQYSHSERGSEGYKNLELKRYLNQLDEGFDKINNDTIGFRYLEEETEIKEAYVDGEIRQVEVRDLHDADVYWNHPNYLFFRGSESDSEKAVKATKRRVSGSSSNLDPIKFDPNFLLWVFYKQFDDVHNNNPPNLPFDIDRLTDAGVKGDEDIFGGDNTIGDSTELVSCPPLLGAILEDKRFSKIEGTFSMSPGTVRAAVQSNKVHIKSSKGSLSNEGGTRRIGLSLLFLRKLVDLYDQWENSMSKTNKHPPLSFFEKVNEVASDRGHDIDVNRNVLEYYEEKRNENWNI
ncbi:MAG: hypothetical protein U5J64_10385 [Halobacteriales archaeon]|nr:hypothetical protein [Halobacteriales archaeon]